ncbi:hypothetical protein [Prochlorococcus sp. MIT 1223]|nr:hypothetical protein [Prochlorococcus sp. MIT 1223]
MNTDNLVVINLAAILVGSTYNSEQKVIKWGGVIIAVASVASTLLGS